MSTLTNDLARLANNANVLVTSITTNSSAITSVNVAGVVINSSGIISNSGFTANGSLGIAGQVLTTNGSGAYWSSAGVNTAATYTWSNAHSFNGVVTFAQTAVGTVNNSLYLGGTDLNTLQGQITSNASAAYTNAVSYTDTKIGTANSAITGNSTTAYTNAVSYTDSKILTANSAITGNADSAYTNATIFASNASNINSGTIAEARLPYRMDQNVRTTDTITLGNLTLTGNLYVGSNVNVIGANNLSVIDNMIYLNANNTITNPDLGFAGNYNDGTYAHAGFFRDASDGIWKVFDNYLPEPDANSYIDTTNTSFHVANFQANTLNAGNTSTNWFIANVGGTYVSGTVNAASYTVGTSFTANAIVVNAVSYYAGSTLIGNTVGPYGKTEGNLNVNSATYATSAGSATNATTATTATNATYATSAGSATNAITANNSTYAFGKTEGNLNVNSATYATSAGSATNATAATNATYATSAGSATNASAATNATYATSAGSATNATYATSAGSAGSATNASAATNATYATSAGSATNATFATTAGAAAGEWRLLNTLTASSSPSLSDTSNITSTYTHYAFILNQVKPATNGTHLNVRYYVSGAFQSASYWWVGTGSNLGTGAFSTGSTGGSEIRIGNPNGINTSYDGLSGMFYLTNPSGGGYKMLYGIGGFIDGNPQQTSLWHQGAYRGSTAAVTGIQFYMSSGNIASGSISIYGIKS